MLPLSLLSTATGQAMLIELKNGDTYNGKLVGADTWMNVNLEDVICTSRDGDRFWKLKECYIRGNSIKYLRIPDEIIDLVQEEEISAKDAKKGGKGGRGRVNTSGRGRGRGRQEAREVPQTRDQDGQLSRGLVRVRGRVGAVQGGVHPGWLCPHQTALCLLQ